MRAVLQAALLLTGCCAMAAQELPVIRDAHDPDLNHDGWLDVRDMQAFANGARP